LRRPGPGQVSGRKNCRLDTSSNRKVILPNSPRKVNSKLQRSSTGRFSLKINISIQWFRYDFPVVFSQLRCLSIHEVCFFCKTNAKTLILWTVDKDPGTPSYQPLTTPNKLARGVGKPERPGKFPSPLTILQRGLKSMPPRESTALEDSFSRYRWRRDDTDHLVPSWRRWSCRSRWLNRWLDQWRWLSYRQSPRDESLREKSSSQKPRKRYR